jgi:hypothetical protein
VAGMMVRQEIEYRGPGDMRNDGDMPKLPCRIPEVALGGCMQMFIRPAGYCKS